MKLKNLFTKKKVAHPYQPTFNVVEPTESIAEKQWIKEFNFGRLYTAHNPMSEAEAKDTNGMKLFQIRNAINKLK